MGSTGLGIGRLRLGIILTALLAISPGAAGAQVLLDRVLAVVENQIITLSDVRAALKFQLVPPDVSTDPTSAALQRLIDRRLMLLEIERYAPPEPPAAQVDGRVAAIEAGFKDALALEIALNQTAMSREELRRFIQDNLRIESYLEQRFATAVSPSDDDILQYYREHPAEFTSGGQLRPFEEVRDLARARVLEQQRARIVQQWMEGLRRRASILVPYLPGR